MSVSLDLSYADHPLMDRPFVPSMAPEDLDKCEEIGLVTPKSVCPKLDKPAPSVPGCIVPLGLIGRAGWNTLHIKDKSTHRVDAYKKLINEIDFLQLMDMDDIMEEGEAWLEEQVSFMNDQENIVHGNMRMPPRASVTIQIIRTEPLWSIGSLAGMPNVFVPFGKNNSPITLYEMLYVDIVWAPVNKNCWRVQYIHPKIPPELISSTTVNSSGGGGGHQYVYNIALNPHDIGSVIGKNGQTLYHSIHDLDRHSYIELEEGGIPLPEITIKPLNNVSEGSSMSFSPTISQVRVLLPVGCHWNKYDVDEIIRRMHC
jgi:hypothetical protein